MSAGRGRLAHLVSLRDQLDREIAREREALARIEKVRRDALTVLTRVEWNDRVLAACCQHWGVTPEDVAAGSRYQAAVDARHAFMWLMRVVGRSFPEIGDALRMDHSSAINGVRRVERTPALQAAAAAVYRSLTGEDDPLPTRAAS